MNYINYNSILRGLISYIPYSYFFYKKLKKEGAHSSSNARFCYSLWLRILVTLYNHNHFDRVSNIAELGSSSSLGVGLAALLTGTQSYTALEIVRSEMLERNIRIFDELVELFKNKEDIPDDQEYPKINIKLISYKFPNHIFTKEVHTNLLKEERLQSLRESIQNYEKSDQINNKIKYIVPWEKSLKRLEGNFSFIFSRAVMEHITDYKGIYNKLMLCLKPEGIMFHDIEYHCHKTSKYWNGHWCYPSFLWKLVKGERPFVINRATHSTHCRFLKSCNLNLIHEDRNKRESKLEIKNLSKKFRNMSSEDFHTCGGYILVSKTGKHTNIE